MSKETVTKRKRAKPANPHAAASKNAKDGFATVEALLPAGSPQRAAAGIAAAAVGTLAAVAWFGLGPAALAGAAGYLAYRATGRK